MAYRMAQRRRWRGRIWGIALLFLLAMAIWSAWTRFHEADETLNQTPADSLRTLPGEHP